jgi:hypothetical protein
MLKAPAVAVLPPASDFGETSWRGKEGSRLRQGFRLRMASTRQADAATRLRPAMRNYDAARGEAETRARSVET